jgi:Fe2+ or Zn2+ uptake regulation protein
MSLPFSSSSRARKASNGESWDRISDRSSHPYVVCLDCGKQFEYDWSKMRVVK